MSLFMKWSYLKKNNIYYTTHEHILNTERAQICVIMFWQILEWKWGGAELFSALLYKIQIQ